MIGFVLGLGLCLATPSTPTVAVAPGALRFAGLPRAFAAPPSTLWVSQGPETDDGYEPDTVQPDPYQTDPYQAEPYQADPDQAEPYPAEAYPQDAEEPSSGIGLIIPGAIMTGLGVVNLGSAAICVTDFYRNASGQAGSDLCLVTSLVFGGALLAAGLPMLIVGVVRRGDYNAWKEQYGEVSLGPTRGGAALGWTYSF